jgi:hypothetical protein
MYVTCNKTIGAARSASECNDKFVDARSLAFHFLTRGAEALDTSLLALHARKTQCDMKYVDVVLAKVAIESIDKWIVNWRSQGSIKHFYKGVVKVLTLEAPITAFSPFRPYLLKDNKTFSCAS